MQNDPRNSVFLSQGIRTDGKRAAIHPADVKGKWSRRKKWAWGALVAFYLLAPLVRVGGHPAVHLDIAARRFYLFGATFNAQDFWLVLFLATTVALGLVFITAWLGRAWCGWACPQTVFLEGLFRPIERFVDGPRERRLKAEKAPWTAARVARWVFKHALYVLAALAVSHTFLSLFVSWRDLYGMVLDGPAAHPVAFAWAMSVAGLLYGNFAWFREQLCLVVCPYGRLQSALQDKHSIVVGYDTVRGEPRGRPKPGVVTGDCVDCNRCVMVCPTGIDIRNGLQMECVACMACVDACDDVMDKTGRPRGLIRFDSLAGLAGEPRQVVRPRLLIYGSLLGASALALVLGLALRTPFEANLLRLAGPPYVLDGASVRNSFEVHLVNKHPETVTFRLTVKGLPDSAQVLLPQAEVRLDSLEGWRIPLFVTLPRAAFATGAKELVLEVTDERGEKHEAHAPVLGPVGMPAQAAR